MASRPYAGEEVLTYDRIRRAVTSRVVDAAEVALEQGAPLDQQRLQSLVLDEWKALKEAVRNSPTAKEKARERMRGLVAGILENHIKTDQSELESLGVQKKPI